jgi:type IV pilus assembly protein PilC
MKFQYSVRDPLGNQHQGTLEAATAEDAQQQLRSDGFYVLTLEENEGEGLNLFARGVAKIEIIYATNQLAIMVETGITLSTALQSIVEQSENPTFRTMLADIKKRVEGGEDFSNCLEKYPKYFDHTYVSLVRASEATGTLGEMLERIGSYLRKELETRSKVRSAMAYPGIMAALAIGVTTFLLVYILPKFSPLFTKKGIELPGITVVMMAVSDCMIHYWYLWILGVGSLVAGIAYARRTEPGRRTIDWLKINLPIFGAMFRKVTISRSVRTLGTMISSGVSVLDAIRMSGDVSGNYYYEKLWYHVLDRVTSGIEIHVALSESTLFPPMLIQMIRAGEETGKLDVVLERVSNYYDTEVEQSIKTSTSMIEPIMICAMGVIVGGIALGLLLPIFSLGRVAH